MRRWILLGLGLAAMCAAMRHAPLYADSGGRVHDFSRICAGEQGFQTETGDCAAIVFLLQRRARQRNVPLRFMVRAYSGRHLGTRPSPRPWIAELRLNGRRPLSWPLGVSWRQHRRPWLDLVQHVRDTLEGAVLDPCPGADHWGMRHGVDLERARRAGWNEVECDVETRNAFWRIPPRGRNDG